MNKLREAIATKTKQYMPQLDSDFIFELTGEDSFPAWQDKNVLIKGVRLTEEVVKILTTEGEFGEEEHEYDLQEGYFTADDLILILQKLEE